MTSSAMLPQKIRQKIVDKPSWYKSDGENGWMTIDLSAPPNLLGFAQLSPDPSERLTIEELAYRQTYLDRLYRKMNDATIDIFDIICANWIENKNSAGFAMLYAKDILDLRCIAKSRKFSYETNAKKDIADHVNILRNLWISVNKAPVYEEIDGRRQKTTLRTHGRLILVSGYQDKETERDITPYSWSVMPGEVIQPFFSNPNKQFMLMTKKVLAYHPTKQVIEKRVARHLIWQFRLRQAKGDYLRPFNNEKLLTAACIKIDRRNPARNQDRIEAAFNQLTEDGIISGWQYALDGEDEKFHKKGWIDDWLKLGIIFEPPLEIVNFNANIENKLLHRPKQERHGTLEDLKHFQESNRMTQLKLAEMLNITPAYLSMILHGRRMPPKKIVSKIATLLRPPPSDTNSN